MPTPERIASAIALAALLIAPLSTASAQGDPMAGHAMHGPIVIPKGVTSRSRMWSSCRA
jgi:hypothetical protein